MTGRDAAAKPPKKLYVGMLVLLGLVVWRLWLAPVDATTVSGVVTVEGAVMGTSWSVKVVPPDEGLDAAALRSACQEALDAVDAAMSTYKADSELSRFNRHAATTPFEVSAGTVAVFSVSESVSRLTGGAFDVTVRPLVDAWGFGPDGDTAAPSAATIAALKSQVGWERIQTDADGRTVAKTAPEVTADLSAVAKGWAVDRVAEVLQSRGRERFLVEVGGEVRARGSNGRGEVWRVGIERPSDGTRAVHTIVPLADAAMATSGDYRNYREVDGRRVSHTIDPRTGHPIAHRLASVSVVDSTCARADALATALNVLGPTEGPALAARVGVAALFLVRTESDTNGFEARTTPAFEALGASTPGSRMTSDKR